MIVPVSASWSVYRVIAPGKLQKQNGMSRRYRKEFLKLIVKHGLRTTDTLYHYYREKVCIFDIIYS